MERRKLPGTEIEISPIVYGAFAIGGWFWGGADDADALQAIDAALECGIDAIDTAPVYGMGHSETLVGEALRGRRHEVSIFTKFGMRWDTKQGVFTFDTKDNSGNPVQVYKFNGKQSVIEECERSLRRLQTDYIDLYQMHWPEQTTPIAETMEALALLKEQGKIRAAGLCNSSAALLDDARKTMPLATDQVAYSMADRSIEADLVPYCEANGVGVLAHSVLQKGLLTGKIRPGHRFGENDHRASNAYFQPESLARIHEALQPVDTLARERDVTLAQMAINWAMHRPGVAAVLVGARNAQQARDNAAAMNWTLTSSEDRAIQKAIQPLQQIR